MAKYIATTEQFTATADAIRAKTGASGSLEWDASTGYADDIAMIPTGTDTSDATAAAGDILSGKTAYVDGEKITGTLQVVNRNLLDNWYFVGGGSQLGDGVFPINQRGQTTYSGTGYGVDRWKANLSGAVTINTDSISFLQAHNYDRFCQVINVPPDLPITFTAIVRGGNSGRISITDRTINDSFGNKYFTGELSDWTLLTVTATIPSTYIQDTLEVRIVGTFSANVEIKAIQIQAVKLELGSEQTLAHNEGTEENPVWVLNEVPDYGEELRKCQRYYQLFRTESLRPTYGEDCRPTMATAQPTKGTLTKDGVTYYTLSSEP